MMIHGISFIMHITRQITSHHYNNNKRRKEIDMERKIVQMVQGYPTYDGDGVKLVRVLGNQTIQAFNPILMLDSFDSIDPKEYTNGFPLHPHREIETISYVKQGYMQHKDSLGFQDTVGQGGIQWMTAGKGILHEERIPKAQRLLGVQLWLNLPKKDKLCPPNYHAIHSQDIPVLDLQEIGQIRILAGEYQQTKGYQSQYLPLDYLELTLNPKQTYTLQTKSHQTAMIFTLCQTVTHQTQHIPEKTAVCFDHGDTITLTNPNDQPSVILMMSSIAIDEPVVWGGPIVMNTKEELQQAFHELRNGTFL